MSPLVRQYGEGDAGALAQIFYDAIHIGAQSQYSKEERYAWAPTLPDAASWARWLHGLFTYVAEIEGRAVGFMSLTKDGLLDLAFVTPDQVRRGIGNALHNTIVAKANTLRLQRLTTDASKLARPFLLRRIWVELASQQEERRGVKLLNYRMEKIF